jgi:hypothetical protein
VAAVAWAAAARAPAASAATVAAARAASAAVAASDAPVRSGIRGSGRMWVLGITTTFCGLFLLPGKKIKRSAAAHRPSTLRPRCAHLAAGAVTGSAPREFGDRDWCPKAPDWESLQVPRRRSAGSSGFARLPAAAAQGTYTVGRNWGRGWREKGSESCRGLGEGEGTTAPEPRQLIKRLWQPVGVAPPTGERRAPAAGRRLGCVAALRVRSVWSLKGTQQGRRLGLDRSSQIWSDERC